MSNSADYAPIRRDSDGLATDAWLLAEEIWTELDDENPATLGDLVRYAKSDMAELKRRYTEYRNSDGRSGSTLRKPGEETEKERVLNELTC